MFWAMCSPFPSSYALSTLTLNLLKANVDLSWGTVIRRHHTSSSLVVQAGFSSQQPLFLFGEQRGSEPARRTGPARERPAERALSARDQAPPSSLSLPP